MSLLHTLFLENEEQTSGKKYRVMFCYSIENHMQKFEHFWGKKRKNTKSSLSMVLHSPLQLLYNYYTKNQNRQISHMTMVEVVHTFVIKQQSRIICWYFALLILDNFYTKRPTCNLSTYLVVLSHFVEHYLIKDETTTTTTTTMILNEGESELARLHNQVLTSTCETH